MIQKIAKSNFCVTIILVHHNADVTSIIVNNLTTKLDKLSFQTFTLHLALTRHQLIKPIQVPSLVHLHIFKYPNEECLCPK